MQPTAQAVGGAARRQSPEGAKAALPLARELRIIPLPVRARFKPGDSVSQTTSSRAEASNKNSATGDILVIKHKIVSKAEGQLVDAEQDQALRRFPPLGANAMTSMLASSNWPSARAAASCGASAAS